MVTPEEVITAMAEAELSTSVSNVQVDLPLVLQGLDSLDMATLMFALESKYNRQIPPEKAARLRTISDIVKFLNAP